MAKMLINGDLTDAADGQTIDVIDPVDNSLVDTIPRAAESDIDRALNAAKEGSRYWRSVPLREKEQIFERFYRLLEEHKRDILLTLIKESGCSLRNALMQFQGLPQLFKGYLESAKRLDGHIPVPGTETGHDGHTETDLQMVIHEPLGTVLALIPFNAPLMLFGYKAAPALVTGNAVIVKPPTTNPLAMIKACELLWEAGMPGNVLQVITGNGALIGDKMASDPRIDAITLTGSTEVGLNIAQIAAKRLIPCALELGGNDPFIVMDDADVSFAVQEAAFWRMNSAGQVCISPKRFLVHNAVKREFTQGVLDFVKTITMGPHRNVEQELDAYLNTDFSAFHGKGMVMNSLISEKAAIAVDEQVKLTLSQGAKLAAGGKRHGTFYEPTVLTDVTRDMDVMSDMEIFGPVLPICGFDTMEEAIDIANQSCYGLSGCVFTRDWKKGMHIAREIQSGTMVINGTGTYRNMMHPFGGYKLSGTGREGFATLESVTQEKVIILKGFYQ